MNKFLTALVIASAVGSTASAFSLGGTITPLTPVQDADASAPVLAPVDSTFGANRVCVWTGNENGLMGELNFGTMQVTTSGQDYYIYSINSGVSKTLQTVGYTKVKVDITIDDDKTSFYDSGSIVAWEGNRGTIPLTIGDSQETNQQMSGSNGEMLTYTHSNTASKTTIGVAGLFANVGTEGVAAVDDEITVVLKVTCTD